MSYTPKSHTPCKVDAWHLTPALAQHVMATYPKVNGPRAQERFVRHHMAKATRSACWDAEFLNWVEQDADKIGEHAAEGTDYRGVPNDSRDDWNRYLMGRDS